MKGKLIYIACILMLLYLTVMYQQDMTIVVVGILLFFPFLSLGFGLWMRRSLKIELDVKNQAVEKEEPAVFRVRLQNTSWLPIPYVKLRLTLRNTWTGQNEQIHLDAMIDSRDHLEMNYESSFPHCGRIRCELNSVRVKDYFQIFSLRRKYNCSTELFVFPKWSRMEFMISQYTRNFIMDSDEYDQDRPGDDPSEVFDIREYRRGDSLSRVHWKMSAKTGAMMIKEFSRPIGCSVLFLLDLARDPDEPEDLLAADRYMDTVYSVCYALLEQEVRFEVGWYDERQKEICFRKVLREEDVPEVFYRLYDSGNSAPGQAVSRLYDQASARAKYSSILMLNRKLEFYRNQDLLASFDKALFPECLLSDSFVI